MREVPEHRRFLDRARPAGHAGAPAARFSRQARGQHRHQEERPRAHPEPRPLLRLRLGHHVGVDAGAARRRRRGGGEDVIPDRVLRDAFISMQHLQLVTMPTASRRSPSRTTSSRRGRCRRSRARACRRRCASLSRRRTLQAGRGAALKRVRGGATRPRSGPGLAVPVSRRPVDFFGSADTERQRREKDVVVRRVRDVGSTVRRPIAHGDATFRDSPCAISCRSSTSARAPGARGRRRRTLFRGTAARCARRRSHGRGRSGTCPA